MSLDISITRPRLAPARNELYFLEVFGKNELADLWTDSPDDETARAREKEFLINHFNLSADRIFFLKQTHGTRAREIRQEDTRTNQAIYFNEGDALWTADTDLLLCIRTADCLPVFFIAEYQAPGEEREPLIKRKGGIIHAGWRGLRAGILETVLEELWNQGAADLKVRLFVGPCIGGPAYEVGPEVAELFPVVEEKRDGSYRLDLIANLKKKVGDFKEKSEGNFKNNIRIEWEDTPEVCTWMNNEFYYSHRRGDEGRNLNVFMFKARK